MAEWYRIILEQKQPLNIGGKKYGVISETRLFMPGWTVFGALVNACALREKSPDAFKAWKEKLSCITCFFPALGTENEDILFPELSGDGLHLKSEKVDYNEHDFRRRFVNSYFSTAIDPASQSAAEKLTHEIEIILPSEKRKGVVQRCRLYWTGLLKAEREEIESIKNAERIFVGQDARYGMGELKFFAVQTVSNEETRQYWGLDIKGEEICLSGGIPLRNFLDIDVMGCGIEKVSGSKELIVTEFDFTNSAVPKVREYCFAISPGSRINIEEKITLALKKGLLKAIDAEQPK